MDGLDGLNGKGGGGTWYGSDDDLGNVRWDELKWKEGQGKAKREETRCETCETLRKPQHSTFWFGCFTPPSSLVCTCMYLRR